MAAVVHTKESAARPVAIALGKVAYGAVFVLAVPGLLWLWAARTTALVRLPATHSPPLGGLLMAAGLALVGAGMFALWRYGDGLPMNAYPPPRFVERGIYALVPNPIYAGFCTIVLGAAVYAGSASGLWLVFPVTVVGCIGLVLGYERHDLLRRFGVAHPRAWLRLPDASEERPSWGDRVRVLALAVGPWLVMLEVLAWAGGLPSERSWPVLGWTNTFHASVYLAVALATLVAPSRVELRRFAVRILYAIAIVVPLLLAGPHIASSLDGSHLVIGILTAATFAATWPRKTVLAWAWATAVVVSCATTTVHGLVTVGGGVVVALVVLRARSLWELLRRGAERVAGSWREWRVGPVRVINHGLYGGAAAGAGVLIAGELTGRGSTGIILLMCASVVLCSAIWAQVVECSPQLLRPYGYYGGVIGVFVGAVFAPLFGKSIWLMLAAAATAGPWIQSIGRLRCLVQGCCHGSPAPEGIGIRYTHPRSRVVRLTDLGGTPIHPTPLYSILWNVVIAVVLIRLWGARAPLTLIGGLYFVLAGLGRFVEESYRGEPQTKSFAGLRLYQWIAIAHAVTGVFVTMVGDVGRAPAPELTWPPVLAALVSLLVAGAALGVDFPRSNRPFSRLA